MNKQTYKEILTIAFPPWGKPSPDVNGVVDSYLVASIGIVALSGVSLLIIF